MPLSGSEEDRSRRKALTLEPCSKVSEGEGSERAILDDLKITHSSTSEKILLISPGSSFSASREGTGSSP